MVEYQPWSKKNLECCIDLAGKGEIPVLDLELTAKCSAASCIYCDSMPDVCSNPQIEEISLQQTLKFLEQLVTYGLKWIYTCGLGEPLEDKRMSGILDFIKEHNIHMSMFTNGQFIKNARIAKRLKNSNVNLILKMDTFDVNKFDIILGGKGRAENIYRAIDFLLEAGYADVGCEGYTDLAFSIVPTKLSQETIPQVVDFCLQHNIFPSVGELERAGNVINNDLTEKLGLSEDILADVRCSSKLDRMNYMRPICPAIMAGLHIDNQGNCIVDETTGLNCKWFLLTNPNTKIIGNVCDSSVEELLKKANTYRKKCFEENISTINKYEKINYVFGGCGGNPAEIIKLYKERIAAI